MKILLIVIAYIFIGACVTLGYMILEYKNLYIDRMMTPEEYYYYEVEDVEVLYILICVFWPIAVFGMLICYVTKYLVRSAINILNYIYNGGSNEKNNIDDGV